MHWQAPLSNATEMKCPHRACTWIWGHGVFTFSVCTRTTKTATGSSYGCCASMQETSMTANQRVGQKPTMVYSETKEQKRLNDAREAGIPWKKWGPYLSERQWGTVREDYSTDGNAWAYFSHDQSR